MRRRELLRETWKDVRILAGKQVWEVIPSAMVAQAKWQRAKKKAKHALETENAMHLGRNTRGHGCILYVCRRVTRGCLWTILCPAQEFRFGRSRGCTLGICRCRRIRLTLWVSVVKKHGERPGRRGSHTWLQDTAFRAQVDRCHTTAGIRIILEECDSQSVVPRPAAAAASC